MIPPCYVITLNDNLGEQQIALNKAGIFPEIFKGVDGRKDEYKNFNEKISTFCNFFCTKFMKGCGLSHILLCEKIYKSGVPLALILEDDAFPYENVNIENEINKVLNEVPDDWDIIRLHCDSFCKDGTNSVTSSSILPNASTAAYLVNNESAKKISNFLLFTHVDLQQHLSVKIYKTKQNVFMTDESNSLNRKTQPNIFTPILNYIFPITSGHKTMDMLLSMGIFQIPYFDIVITTGHILNISIFIIIIICLKIYLQ
jgi:GR25 family glycosyltransferase involved in LPS biosynthesis